MKLQGKQIGVLVALILATVMLFLPAQDHSRYRFDPEVLARDITQNRDHIDPATLSQWIIEGRRNFMLIDIREEKRFRENRIKGAVNIPLSTLLRKDTIDELPEDKLLVIYSNGNSHAAQAWLVLKTAGIDAYMLEGGLNYWSQVILDPRKPSGIFSDDEYLRYKAGMAISEYFGGKVSSPAAPDGDGVRQPTGKKRTFTRGKKKKKKLKGC